jgi:glutathione S-transferase
MPFAYRRPRAEFVRPRAKPVKSFLSPFLFPNSTAMKLLSSDASPYARKVRVVMAEKKLDYQLVNVNVWAPDTQITDSNPLGKVPCLVMEGGEAVFDSRVIVEYLDTLSPVGKLIPSQGRERAEVKTWEALADGLMDAALLARMEATFTGRKDSQRNQAWIERQLGKIHAVLKAMSTGLGDKAFCSGVHFSLSDIAVGCALGYLDLRFAQIDWRTSYPNLAKLNEKLMLRASFIETKPQV